MIEKHIFGYLNMSYKQINKELVKEVFNIMKYNDEKEELRETMGDLIKPLSSDEINSFTAQFIKCEKWCSIGNHDREKLMNKLASEIEKGEESFLKLTKNVSSAYIKQKSLPYVSETIRYYAKFCELVEGNSKYVLISKLPEVSNLSLLGYILGPSLAAGCKVLFVASHELGNIVKLIELMMRGIGFPEGTISVLLDGVELESLLKHANVISLFDAVNQKIPNSKIMGVAPLSTPVLVFDSADLDSACECVMNATWKSQLLFDSTAKEVYVQESVYKMFVKKLKENISVSETYNNKFPDTLKNLVSQAEKNGIEVFSCNADASSGKTVFIGGKIIDKSTVAACMSIVAFRNVDEAILLANNNVQGLSASVWTENIGLANYVAQKLEVSNVWINSFGIYSPDVAFKPKKLSGKGFFGGFQGFQEFLFKKNTINFSGDKIISQHGEKILTGAVASAKKGYPSWSTLPKCSRLRHFGSLIQYVHSNTSELKSKSVPIEWLDQWKTLYYQYISAHYDFTIMSPIDGYSLNVSYSPRGVLIEETTSNIETHNIKLLIASLLEGNCLILLNQCEQLQKFYSDLSKELPVGVLSVVPYFNEASGIALRNPEVDIYFNEYTIDEELDQYNKFETVTTAWEDIFNKVTYIKNVWSNIGK